MRKQVLIVIIAVPLAFFFLIASVGGQDYKIQESRIFSYLDTDADGIIDWFDNCPGTINPNQANFDEDKFGDICDIDEDNDGIVNGIDAFAQNPEEWDDFDFDGIGANEDTDDDNDGILDVNDPLPSPVASQLTMKYIDLIENCAIMEPGLPRQLCYRDFLVSLIDKGESNSDVINFSFFLAKRGVIADCHFTAHHIGHSAFEKNPNLSETITSTINTCRNGFHHGVLSAFFVHLEKEGKDVSNLHKVACDEFIDSKYYYLCVHGIGHGLVSLYGDDLRTSLDACNELLGLSTSPCLDGVMMQYTDNKLMSSTSIEEDIAGICSKKELTSDESFLCYAQMGRSLVFLTYHDKEKSEELCNMLEGDEVVLEKDISNTMFCLIGVGQEIEQSDADKKTAEIPFN